MILLVAKAHETLLRYPQRNIARFCGPRNYHRMADSVWAGFLWAADNDAFNGFDHHRYRQMLDELRGIPGCLFVTCPDVVADAAATSYLFDAWYPLLEGFPVAYVLQDGAEWVPWDDIATVFVGGSTEWKLGEDAALLVKEAQARGKWVHMGRVNTWRRLEYAKSIGVDSVDGTKLSWFTDTYLSGFAEMASSPPQMALHTFEMSGGTL